MAEAIALREAADVIEPSSGGLYPLGRIAERTVETLIRNGYPVQGLSSKPLLSEALANADLVINMTGERWGAAFAQVERVEDWDVADPYGEDPHVYQRILEELEGRVQQLAERLREERQEDITAADRRPRAAG